MRVDTVYENARFLTGAGESVALAALNGRIVALGHDAAALSAKRRVDLGGSVVVPGFHDAHNHMAWFGMALDDVALSDCRSVDEVYDAVARRAAETPPGGWIIGSGYDQNKLAGGHPTRQGLDRAAPGHLVRLKHTSGHMTVVNSAVLEQLDLANVPVGGDVVRDGDGSPTGLLREQAQLLLRPLTYPTPIERVVRGLDRASERYLSEGITSVQEAGIGGGLVGETPAELAAYQLARDRGVLRVRSTVMVAASVLHDLDAGASSEARFPAEEPSALYGLDLGMRTGFGDEWLRLGAMKLFADGSLIGRTCAMHEPFAGEPDNVGYFQVPEDEIARTIAAAHRAGWQIATHAIGDRAITVVLDAYEAALKADPRPDHRHRIEHCAVLRPEELKRLASLGLIASPQGRFVNEIGDGMRAALGPEREPWCYRLKSLLDAGCVLPASSDRPVVEGAPLLALADMVRRKTSSGVLLGPEERLTPAEALHAYTYGSAYAAFAEKDLGTLLPGKLADFAVLSADPTDESTLDSIQVVATAVGGDLVYERS
ncbi:amidohydrolase [Amycolatopsis sp. BJA-103]|uniref:amidohydrolase n=1 Tax=unclassified Amycolatopsis TaxID=2618356 RepID=UPI000C78F6FB|nr:amidohydrolase [Amycolatopsis sp. BJA-103]AUI61842.1 hydrolase [Amycolatopsis sp. BJA-103]PNE20860.1 hydrolase [Amycolatopsis sp. BJA-103]